jgi:hypothetical protein
MRRVVHALTANLYKRDPLRQLGAGEEATDWLTGAYRKMGMGAKWHKADQFSLVGDVAAFQFFGDTDPMYPVGVHLWAADQLCVWLSPDNPLEPTAVATIDTFDCSRRLKLYSGQWIATYVTQKMGPFQTSGGTDWQFQGKVPNPYVDADGTPYLPFAFVHAEEPTTDFWTPGLGEYLRQVNDFLNFRLDRLGDSIRFIERPIMLVSGVALDWTIPPDLKPGQVLKLPATVFNVGEDVASSSPTAAYLAPPTEYISADWLDINSYIDHALETCGIPPGTIRMVGNASSGIALMIEQAPLLSWAESRRKPFRNFEDKVATMCCRVAATHLRNNGLGLKSWLEQSGQESKLSLEWASLYVQLPGPERDRADTFELTMGWTDKIRILMDRYDLTREQAIQRLKQVQQNNQDLLALGVDPAPPTPALAGPTAPDGGTDDGQQDPEQIPAE